MNLKNILFGTGLNLKSLGKDAKVKENEKSFDMTKMEYLKNANEIIENKLSLQIATLKFNPKIKDVGEIEERVMNDVVNNMKNSTTMEELEAAMSDFKYLETCVDNIIHRIYKF